MKRGYRRARSKMDKPSLFKMALFGIAGYFTGAALNVTGLPQILYNKSGTFASIRNASGIPAGNAGDGQFIAKLLGAGVGADAIYKSMKSGRVSDKQMNVELPYAIGAILDGPSSLGSNGNGSSGRYW